MNDDTQHAKTGVLLLLQELHVRAPAVLVRHLLERFLRPGNTPFIFFTGYEPFETSPPKLRAF